LIWNSLKNPIPIGELELQVGVYIWIDRSWKEHPFLTNNFLIKTEDELKKLKGIGTENIYWIPEKSKLKQLKVKVIENNKVANLKVIEDENVVASKLAMTKKNEQMAQQRRLVAKAEREWEKAAAMVRESLLSIRDNPKQNGIKLKALSDTIASTIMSSETLLMLLKDKEKNSQGLYHHALNCMSMAVLLAKYLKLPETVISEIALGAIAHDVGQTTIAKHILNSTSRSKVEESVFRDHCIKGVEIAKDSGAFSSVAISMIAEHHEHFDGTGYPAEKKGSDISLAARILSIVDRYETLCGTITKDGKVLMPAEVLRVMWKLEKNRFDPTILPSFIKFLGVYPPGSIVRLSDGAICLAISPGSSSLHPKVIIYDSSVSKYEAEVVDLSPEDDLQIESTVNPKDLPKEILEWMSLGESFSLYFATVH